jgi:MFS family permease
MFAFTDETTGYAYLIGALLVMGLGMGATMMPIMSAALATLNDASIARGSTLMNITQQVAASIGTAVFSVLLTNAFQGSRWISVAGALGNAGKDQDKLAAVLAKFNLAPEAVDKVMARALHDMSTAYAHVFLIATVMLACCLVPALFLPRTKPAKQVDPAVLVGH